MRNFLAAMLLLTLVGCGNLSPKFQPKLDERIDNQNGQIHDITNEQNGLKAEILSLKQQNELLNSKLDHVQQGFFNLQSDSSNTGVQIFSGSGGLMAGMLAIIVVGVVWYYRSMALLNQKSAAILAEKITATGDPDLKEEVFKAAMYTNVESNVYHLMKKAER